MARSVSRRRRGGAKGRAARLVLAAALLVAPLSCSAQPPLVPTSARDLLALARQPGASATLLSVWATWCVPCRQEFPALLRLERAYGPRGLRLLLVSTDFDTTAARAFLARQGVTFRTYLETGDDMSFIDGLSPRWSGALPATFAYDAAGRLVSFWEGKADYTRFEQAVLAAIDHDDTLHVKERTR